MVVKEPLIIVFKKEVFKLDSITRCIYFLVIFLKLVLMISKNIEKNNPKKVKIKINNSLFGLFLDGLGYALSNTFI